MIFSLDRTSLHSKIFCCCVLYFDIFIFFIFVSFICCSATHLKNDTNILIFYIYPWLVDRYTLRMRNISTIIVANFLGYFFEMVRGCGWGWGCLLIACYCVIVIASERLASNCFWPAPRYLIWGFALPIIFCSFVAFSFLLLAFCFLPMCVALLGAQL